jgi:imidazole glycerol phosphate synthase glutamine amidotransferase subunit
VTVTVVDLGVNNIRSVVGALEHVGIEATVAARPEQLGDFCLIPGIGHFGFVAGLMHEQGWMQAVRQHAASGKPVLGICLGMQLLFEGSVEAPGVDGLGLLPGQVSDVADMPIAGERLPVTGWRKLESTDPEFAGRNMYFNHSFGRLASEPHCLVSYSYGRAHIAAVVGRGRVMGLQFHPEKSGLAGLHLLKHCIDRISKGNI